MQQCQCPKRAVATNPISWYKPEEYKAMDHKPNECPGDYEVKKYKRKGKFIWLCSCCCLYGDEEVYDYHSTVYEHQT